MKGLGGNSSANVVQKKKAIGKYKKVNAKQIAEF